MTEKAKPVFRIEAIPESAPHLPDEIHKPSSSREEYKPKTWTGMLAYERIQKGYKAFAGGGDLTVTSCIPLNPFYCGITGLQEIVSNSIIDLLVWDSGYAFATSNNSYTTHSGTSWSGNSLNRMKYDESGRIYDQAFFYEDLKGIDKIVGELFELQDVKDDLWEMFGRRF
ncbi:hypothetical protein HDU93_009456 [Gonapodya sp. JEL0774]|nr:hypothetical protein HDU93_009456 [Gonapodya sp. JEL0774]